MKTIYTSAGIIRNADQPRLGVVSANSLESFIFDEIDQGIDLDYEMLRAELEKKGFSEEAIDENLENYQNDCSNIIFGDWVKVDGKYEPDKSKEYAAEFSSDRNMITVVWSKHVKPCRHTSPCYVMANGDGPCADLDTTGNAVLGYDLPKDFYREEK